MMTKSFKLAVLPAAAILAGGTATLSANEGESLIAVPASEFSPMQRYAVTYEEPEEMAKFYVRSLELSVRDAEFVEGRNPRNPNNKVVIATVENIENPLVSAIQWRIELKADGNAWETVEAGLRRKCQRGPNANQWTREVCP